MENKNKSLKFNKAVSSADGDYKKKYRLNPSIANKYAVNISNPTVQPDARTEMGIPIPDDMNVEFSKEYEEENQR